MAISHDISDANGSGEDYREETTVLPGESRYIEVAPPRRALTLQREVATGRILAATHSFRGGDPDHYQLNWTLSLRSGPAASYPRRFGIPLARVRDLLSKHDCYELALSIRSDSDPALSSQSITGLTIRIFKDRRLIS